MAKVVIDSQAMIAYLNGEENSGKIGGFLQNCAAHKVELLMSAVNFGEIYYIVLRAAGEEKARLLEGLISAIPIRIIDADTKAVKAAATYKAYKKMSYADCFCAALAKATGGAILTGDKEFKEVEGEIKILWI